MVLRIGKKKTHAHKTPRTNRKIFSSSLFIYKCGRILQPGMWSRDNVSFARIERGKSHAAFSVELC